MISSSLLQRICNYLGQLNNKVAETTSTILSDGSVNVYWVSELSRSSLTNLFPAILRNRDFTRRRKLKRLNQVVDGVFQAPNTIILRDSMLDSGIEKLTDVLVHECNHYLNQADPFVTREEKFTHEYKAFVAQKMCLKGETDPRKVENSALRSMRRHYPALIPKYKVKAPTGIYYR